MREFKTSEDQRINYIYYFNDGTEYIIPPGENGENTTVISRLHEMDDDEFNADRREHDHCPVRYASYHDGEGDDAEDRNPYLADSKSEPLAQMLISIEAEEYADRLDRLKAAIATLTDRQRDTVYKKFWRQMSNVDIAAEEGVSEAAIRNRLKKIYANLAKKI